MTWQYCGSCKSSPAHHSQSGQLESDVYVYRRANNYVTTAVTSVKINLPALVQTLQVHSKLQHQLGTKKKKNRKTSTRRYG